MRTVHQSTIHAYCSSKKKFFLFELLFMASGNSDRDALSKLLQMGTVAEYQSEFEILINRVMRISESLLKWFYISGLKLALQIKLLRARPATLGEAFYLARIIEARLKAIAEKEKEEIIKKKADVILSLRSELASPDIKRSLDGDEDIGVDEVSSVIDCVFDSGKSLIVFLKWVQITRSRPLLLMVSLENTDAAMGKEVKIQRRIWDPGIKIVFRQHLEDNVVSEGVRSVTIAKS
nr:retrotransposon Gag protein [Tanacetum cinerariifolium]GEV34223.1 retrotransposon Gag protein [Tanacetum cinerariifolium]